MTNSLRRLWADTLFALCKLNQAQFSAPWRSEQGRCG